MALRNFYANTKATGFTINFFSGAGVNPRVALLAAPFFTTNDPIEALTKRGCDVSLVVRFSPATTPDALQVALENPRVKVRYFTDAKFHTKLYIVDDVALVGSANLTKSGLRSNRELSILLRQDRDEAFYELPGIFDELWNQADVLTEEILKKYRIAFKSFDAPNDEDAFEKHVHKYINPAAPESVVVGSAETSRERAFIQNFRRKYDEILFPAHDEILQAAIEHGLGRPEYRGQDPQIELGRFLGWLRLVHGSGDGWRQTVILADPHDRSKRISQYVREWQSTEDIVKGDLYRADDEIKNISNIKKYLCVTEELKSLSFDELFGYLIGCHAFLERLRFAPKNLGEHLSGVERLRMSFQRDNDLQSVVRTINYLLSGPGDAIERAYDCVFGAYKLKGFGEACVMELLGWGDPNRPPINNRSIRGIRLLGFDVENLVSGQ